MAYGRARAIKEPQDAEKLTDELEKCVQIQTTMKDVNAYWRGHGTCVGAPGITEVQAAKLDNKIATSQYSWERQQLATTEVLPVETSEVSLPV